MTLLFDHYSTTIQPLLSTVEQLFVDTVITKGFRDCVLNMVELGHGMNKKCLAVDHGKSIVFNGELAAEDAEDAEHADCAADSADMSHDWYDSKCDDPDAILLRSIEVGPWRSVFADADVEIVTWPCMGSTIAPSGGQSVSLEDEVLVTLDEKGRQQCKSELQQLPRYGLQTCVAPSWVQENCFLTMREDLPNLVAYKPSLVHALIGRSCLMALHSLSRCRPQFSLLEEAVHSIPWAGGRWVFHGTEHAKVARAILEDGFAVGGSVGGPRVKNGQEHGEGIYVTTSPEVALKYGKFVILSFVDTALGCEIGNHDDCWLFQNVRDLHQVAAYSCS